MAAVEKLFIENIEVPARKREADPEVVKTLAASMEKIGLRTPITIRSNDDSMAILVAGLHRLEAAKLLGWEKIDCFVLDCDEIEAELWEISENLHRAGLTKEQRDEQIRRYAELMQARDEIQVRQNDAPEIGYKKPPPQKEGIASKVAKETGLSVRTVQRVLADPKPEPKPVSPPSNYPQDDHERSVKWRRSFERLWNDAPALADKEWAKDWIDRPIMDSGDPDMPRFLRRSA